MSRVGRLLVACDFDIRVKRSLQRVHDCGYHAEMNSIRQRNQDFPADLRFFPYRDATAQLRVEQETERNAKLRL